MAVTFASRPSSAPSPAATARSRRRGHRGRGPQGPRSRPSRLRDRLFDESGKLRRFVNVFVADEDIRFLDGLDTPVADGATLSIVPAVAGG
jgi:hypothetical protein